MKNDSYFDWLDRCEARRVERVRHEVSIWKRTPWWLVWSLIIVGSASMIIYVIVIAALVQQTIGAQ